mgnify:CR=1 FL=1
MLTRLERGAYVVTRKNKKQEEISCLLVNGNGRDLSFLKDDSMDAIITDYFYELPRNLIADPLRRKRQWNMEEILYPLKSTRNILKREKYGFGM